MKNNHYCRSINKTVLRIQLFRSGVTVSFKIRYMIYTKKIKNLSAIGSFILIILIMTSKKSEPKIQKNYFTYLKKK